MRTLHAVDGPLDDDAREEARPPLAPEQRDRFERHLAEILEALGMDLDTPGTRGTPSRLLQALVDATDGYSPDPKLITLFPIECARGERATEHARGERATEHARGERATEHARAEHATEHARAEHATRDRDDASQIVEGPIPFVALCEHHALPFFGQAHVGYVAGDQLIGLSKLTRLVRQYARRFTLQERVGSEVAGRLEAIAGARGVAVRLEAVHLCTQMRGVREVEARTRTVTWRGLFARDAQLRAEFLALCDPPRR